MKSSTWSDSEQEEKTVMTITEGRKRSSEIISVPMGKESHKANFSQQFETHGFTVFGPTAGLSAAKSEIEARYWLLMLMLPSLAPG